MWDLDSLLQRMAESVVLTLLPSITLAWDSTGVVSPGAGQSHVCQSGHVSRTILVMSDLGLVTHMSQTHVLKVRHVSNTCPIVMHVSDMCLGEH